jgi:hypothetical protein
VKITSIGYFGRTTNLREPLAPLNVDQLADAIAALPSRKPLGRPTAEIVPIGGSRRNG